MAKRSYDKLPASMKNPYRAGSMKARAFEVFREGGEREAILAKVCKLGATPSTAATWLNRFSKLAAAG